MYISLNSITYLEYNRHHAMRRLRMYSHRSLSKLRVYTLFPLLSLSLSLSLSFSTLTEYNCSQVQQQLVCHHKVTQWLFALSGRRVSLVVAVAVVVVSLILYFSLVLLFHHLSHTLSLLFSLIFTGDHRFASRSGDTPWAKFA